MCSSESRATVIIAKTNEACKVRYATFVKQSCYMLGLHRYFLASVFVDSVYFTVFMICVNLCKILILIKTDLTGTYYML